MKKAKGVSFSNTTINRAGKILIKKSPGKIELTYALDVLDKWRAWHAYPMNTFQATLRKKVKSLRGKAIIAQRLKRLPTIIEKLKRFPTMELARMQDIGGLRAILGSVGDVRKLCRIYRKTKFNHEEKDFKDYISNPKPSGYRGIHLIYKYKNRHTPEYDGMLLELQFRTKLQHIWATTVETMGTFSGKALKSSQGDEEWLNFFKITSSAFACLENATQVPGYEKLSKKETYKAVSKAEEKLDVINKMKGFTLAARMIDNNRKDKGWYYHLIILDSVNKRVDVRSYAKEQLRVATVEYAKVEKRASAGEKIETVLVSAGPLASLRTAYPNYFLDTADFIEQLTRIKSIIKKRSS